MIILEICITNGWFYLQASVMMGKKMKKVNRLLAIILVFCSKQIVSDHKDYQIV